MVGGEMFRGRLDNHSCSAEQSLSILRRRKREDEEEEDEKGRGGRQIRNTGVSVSRQKITSHVEEM